MELNLIELLQGIFSLIFVILVIFVGISIIYRYFEYKKREFLLIGIGWIGLAGGWLPDAISFLMIVLMNNPLNKEAYFIIGVAFLPVFMIIWLTGIMDILTTEKKRIIMIFINIMVVSYEIIFWYFLITDSSQIGTFLGPFQVEYHPLIDLYLLLLILMVTITGILIARHSLRSENVEIKLKGKLLLGAFVSFFIGAISDVFVPLSPITVVITRCILILGAILFYFGFLSRVSESETQEDEVQEFLQLISKHKRENLTEEEVTFYREQKICLVCRGKVSGLLYLCPNCNALYCFKCAKALSNLENACWICETAIDSSKPVKIVKETKYSEDVSHKKI
jgi:hypothetical protein